MGPLGWQETVFLFMLALLIFGPRKLPELGKTIGKAVTEFRRASSELKATFDREMHSIEKENESIKEISREFNNDLYNHYNYDNYEYGSDVTETASSTPSTTGASATQGTGHDAGTNGAAPTGTPSDAGAPGTPGATQTADARVPAEDPFAPKNPAPEPKGSQS